jgi:putative ABC transport system permease protein
MWRNYLTTGFRVLMNNQVYTFVNVAGLAIGVAAAVLIFLYVHYETSYDKWLPASDRIAQLQTIVNPRDGETSRSSLAPRVAVEALRREFPEFEQIVGMMKSRTAIVHEGEARWSDVYWSDPNFF